MNSFQLHFGPDGAQTADSIQRPVVSAFLTVELGNVEGTTKMSYGCTQKCCAMRERSLVKEIMISIWDTVKIGQEMRIHFE